MQNQITIVSKEDILRESKRTFEEIQTFINSVSDEQINVQKDGKWSILEEFSHVILSLKPLVSSLKLPKIAFMAFGKPNRPSRTFDELVKRYQEKLDEGGVAPKQFSPKENLESKEELLKLWSELSKKYLSGVESHWKEGNLDKHLAPHPLLGKITIREMFFFTAYHSNYHLQNMKKKAS
jgi:hypothetical protein